MGNHTSLCDFKESDLSANQNYRQVRYGNFESEVPVERLMSCGTSSNWRKERKIESVAAYPKLFTLDARASQGSESSRCSKTVSEQNAYLPSPQDDLIQAKQQLMQAIRQPTYTVLPTKTENSNATTLRKSLVDEFSDDIPAGGTVPNLLFRIPAKRVVDDFADESIQVTGVIPYLPEPRLNTIEQVREGILTEVSEPESLFSYTNRRPPPPTTS